MLWRNNTEKTSAYVASILAISLSGNIGSGWYPRMNNSGPWSECRCIYQRYYFRGSRAQALHASHIVQDFYSDLIRKLAIKYLWRGFLHRMVCNNADFGDPYPYSIESTVNHPRAHDRSSLNLGRPCKRSRKSSQVCWLCYRQCTPPCGFSRYRSCSRIAGLEETRGCAGVP